MGALHVLMSHSEELNHAPRYSTSRFSRYSTSCNRAWKTTLNKRQMAKHDASDHFIVVLITTQHIKYKRKATGLYEALVCNLGGLG